MSKVLSIMIPVYNGEKYLGSLLEQFEAYFSSLTDQNYVNKIELRVINNVSKDKTGQVADKFKNRIPNYFVHHETEHVKTAEENVFRSFSKCLGEYVWVLGVDDLPVFSNFPLMIAQLEKQEGDFYLFNTATINERFEVVSSNMYESSNSQYKLSIVEAATRLGIWYCMAGISNQILRRRLIENYDINALKEKTSVIYAHVIAYMERYSQSDCYMMNYPIVFYKVTYRDVSHWKKAAELLNCFDEYFWTLGFIRQLKYLENLKIIQPDFLRYALDRNEYFIFRPVCVVIQKIMDQLRMMSQGTDQRNTLSRDQFYEMFDYIHRCDPLSRELLWQIEDVYLQIENKAVIKKDRWDQLNKNLAKYAKNFLLSNLFVEKYIDFEIYRYGSLFLGIRSSFKENMVNFIRSIEPQDYFPIFVVGQTREEIHSKIFKLAGHKEIHDHSLNSVAQTTKALDDLKFEMEYFMRKNMKLVHDKDILEKRNHDMFMSLQWEILAPIRIVMKIIRKFRKKED